MAWKGCLLFVFIAHLQLIVGQNPYQPVETNIRLNDQPAPPRPGAIIHFPKDHNYQQVQPIQQAQAQQSPGVPGRQIYEINFGNDPKNNIKLPIGQVSPNLAPSLGRPSANSQQNALNRQPSNSFPANAQQGSFFDREDDDDGNVPVVKNTVGYQATNFALKLFKNIDRPQGRDSVISPLLPQLLLSNLIDYSSPKAGNQLLNAVQLNPIQLADLTKSLGKASRSSVNTIETASASFVANDLHLNRSFQEESRLRDVEVIPMDFSKPNLSARKVNNWVSEKTHNLINEIINPGAINSYTRLLLANSIFFKGKWKYSFIESKPGVFESSPNNPRQMDKMFQLNKLRYGEMQFPDGNGLRWVELPYEGDSLAMMVFLPTKQHQLEASIRQLTTDHLAQAMANLKTSYINTKVHLQLPKFTLTDSVSMVPALQRMGVSSIFQESDALQYLAKESTVVSDLTQRSFLSVDEIGTKATSVASLSIVTLSITPQYRDVRFDVSEPFLAMIVDKQAQYPIFIGQIYDPRE